MLHALDNWPEITPNQIKMEIKIELRANDHAQTRGGEKTKREGGEEMILKEEILRERKREEEKIF